MIIGVPGVKTSNHFKVFDFAHDPNLISNINSVFFVAC